MNKPTSSTPLRPQLVFRVGITGARCLGADQRERIAGQLREALSLVRSNLEELCSNDRVANFYDLTFAGQTGVQVRLISPLAKGSDRLAAQAAYDLGIPVDVAMPFHQAIYETDFNGKEAKCPQEPELSASEDLAEFRRLLTQSEGKVMLDGARNSVEWFGGDLFEGQSYEAVGHYVVRHCDLLLAVWSGGAGGGRGGTQEIVEYATRAGVPVWWIHAIKDEPPRWLADRLDLHHHSAPDASAVEALSTHLKRLIPAPASSPHVHRTVLTRLANVGKRLDQLPATQYFTQQRLPKNRIFYAYKYFIGFINWRRGRPPEEPWTPPPSPSAEAPAYWYRRYEEADSRANDCTARYRSSYVLVILLTAFSLIVGSIAELFTGPYEHQLLFWLALTEVLLLAGTVFLLLLSIREDWHLKSVEYRLLAELFRKQKTLATLGWALSIGGVEHLADSEGLSWVAWLLAATQRASPFPHCEVDEAGVTRVRVDELKDLIVEQIKYHEQRRTTSSEASERLEHVGGVAFVLLAIVAVLRMPLAYFDDACWHDPVRLVFGLLCVVLPSISAAFLAIRSYAELQLLAEQSRTMIADLNRALNRLDPAHLDPARPLASQALGEQAGAVAMLMLQELEGWGRIFRGKLLEMP